MIYIHGYQLEELCFLNNTKQNAEFCPVFEMGSHEEIFLRKWSLKFNHKGQIKVQGVNESLAPGGLWKSSIITKRLDQKLLESSTGSTYHLTGPLDDTLVPNFNIPDHIIRKFRHGFPINWKEPLRLPQFDSSTNDLGSTICDLSIISLRSGRSIPRSILCKLKPNSSNFSESICTDLSDSNGKKTVPKSLISSLHSSIKNKAGEKQFSEPKPVKAISSENGLIQRPKNKLSKNDDAKCKIKSSQVVISSQERSICNSFIKKAKPFQFDIASCFSTPCNQLSARLRPRRSQSRLRNEVLNSSYNTIMKKRHLSPSSSTTTMVLKRLKQSDSNSTGIEPSCSSTCNFEPIETHFADCRVTLINSPVVDRNHNMSCIANTHRTNVGARNLRFNRPDLQSVKQKSQMTYKKDGTASANEMSIRNPRANTKLSSVPQSLKQNDFNFEASFHQVRPPCLPLKMTDNTNIIQNACQPKTNYHVISTQHEKLGLNQKGEKGKLVKDKQTTSRSKRKNCVNFLENKGQNLNIISEKEERKLVVSAIVNKVHLTQIKEKFKPRNRTPIPSTVTEPTTRNERKYTDTPVIKKNVQALKNVTNSYIRNLIASSELPIETARVISHSQSLQTPVAKKNQALIYRKKKVDTQENTSISISLDFETPIAKRKRPARVKTEKSPTGTTLSKTHKLTRLVPVRKKALSISAENSSDPEGVPVKNRTKMGPSPKQTLGKKGTMKRRKQIREFFNNHKEAEEKNDEFFLNEMPSVANIIFSMKNMPNSSPGMPCVTPKSDSENTANFLLPASVKRIYCSPANVVSEVDDRVSDKYFYAQAKWKKQRIKEAKKTKFLPEGQGTASISSKLGTSKEDFLDILNVATSLFNRDKSCSDISMDEYFSESEHEEDAFQALIQSKPHLFQNNS